MAIEKLTTKSKFYIDVSAWETQGRDFRREVYETLCPECQAKYAPDQAQMVDHVDPETGQVTRMDVLLECASELCANAPDFVTPRMPLTRSIFRALIAAGNLPQSAEDMFVRIKKGSPQIILKELLSAQMVEEGVIAV